ncbi:hypothetical protein CR513_17029, partial [Mucuna pruriens]
MLETKLLGLECLNELYKNDIDFEKRFCVPKNYIKDLLVNEAHEDVLKGHFGELKTYKILYEHFFWPHMRKDIHHVCERCLVCKMAKSKVSPHGLYTPLSIPITPRVYISMDFILDLPGSIGGRDYIFVVVDRFSKFSYFIPCHKVDDACNVTNIFFKEVMRLHCLPKTIVSDRDSKFLGHFWRIVWNKLGTKPLFSTTCHP